MMEHRKFVRLVAVLGLPRAHVRGLLECLWDVAYQCGEQYLGDTLDVELAAGWTGEPGALCRALTECGGNGDAGFIEQLPDRPGRFQVHDLFHHAPDYVRKRWIREAERLTKRADLQAKAGHGPVTDRSLTGQRPDNGRSPAPSPNKETTETRDASAAPGGGGDVRPDLTLTPPEDTPPSGKGGKKRRRAGTPDLSRLIKHYADEFKRTQGSAPVIGAADAAGAQKVLGGRSYEDAAKLVTAFLENPDDWTRERGLLRLRDLPAAATKILARASPGNGGNKRAPDGTPVGELAELINDTVELDEAGVKRKVRIWSERATGREVRRRWGAAVEVVNG
jgi:hypothetical protein